MERHGWLDAERCQCNLHGKVLRVNFCCRIVMRIDIQQLKAILWYPKVFAKCWPTCCSKKVELPPDLCHCLNSFRCSKTSLNLAWGVLVIRKIFVIIIVPIVIKVPRGERWRRRGSPQSFRRKWICSWSGIFDISVDHHHHHHLSDVEEVCDEMDGLLWLASQEGLSVIIKTMQLYNDYL